MRTYCTKQYKISIFSKHPRNNDNIPKKISYVFCLFRKENSWEVFPCFDFVIYRAVYQESWKHWKHITKLNTCSAFPKKNKMRDEVSLLSFLLDSEPPLSRCKSTHKLYSRAKSILCLVTWTSSQLRPRRYLRKEEWFSEPRLQFFILHKSACSSPFHCSAIQFRIDKCIISHFDRLVLCLSWYAFSLKVNVVLTKANSSFHIFEIG